MSWGRAGWLTPDFVPESTVVQSDDEFSKYWQDKFATTQQQIGPQSTGYNTPWWQSANISNLANAGQGDRSPYEAVEKLANNMGLTLTADNSSGGFNVGRAADLQIGYTPPTDNPAFGELSDAFRKASETRAYDQNRQRQAYGQMQGGNYFGGFMDNRYSEPFTGQMQQGTQANGDPTSGGAAGAPGASSFGETFGQRPRQYRAGAWGGYGW